MASAEVTNEMAPTEEAAPVKPRMIKKQKYFAHIKKAFDEYPRILMVNADFVGSMQMHQLRAMSRKDSLIVFGKNTQMKKAIGEKAQENPDVGKLIPHLKGNVGLVFTHGDAKEVRDLMASNKVPAPAKTGAIAQVDVSIPAGLTGMEPTQTSFFQALNIPTKINKGQIEILTPVQLLTTGEKVGASEVALLAKMNMKPFSYGLKFLQVYDQGNLFSSDILDITDDNLKGYAQEAFRNIAALSLAIGHPTQVSMPHMMLNGLKDLVAISVATDYTIGPAEKIKKILDDPEALAAMSAAAAAAPAGGDAKGEAAAAPEPEEEEEEEDMDFDLFD